MTDKTHPITPPPKLVRHWIECCDAETIEVMIEEVARWGADQELEACCEWLKTKEWIHPEFSDELQAARRPKPPSLKEQALEELKKWSEVIGATPLDTIRRALEQLDD